MLSPSQGFQGFQGFLPGFLGFQGFLLCLLLATDLASASPRCPFYHGGDPAGQPADIPMLNNGIVRRKELDYRMVKKDLAHIMTDSKPEWPADYGHYGPLMVRLAWHNAGSYRQADGRGGADGARQRFEPERSWDDNVNLDKARALLWPVKMKYGADLSWGDLLVLAGDVAIESMGGKTLGFCGGRIDDYDGSESLPLDEAEFISCEFSGRCGESQGTSTVGLIYVNPEGHDGHPVPSVSAEDIRLVFGGMGMNDTETVALIGGGHAFGKAHGPCPTGPGPKPSEDPVNPWPGTCGLGKGEDTWTSGFEFPFTTNPTKWDNEYFQNLLHYDWKVWKGPGGHHQWEVSDPPMAPSASGNSSQPIGMLTTDIALLNDPIYLDLVRLYASDITALDHDFMHAWYKLTTRDMGPHSRCIGSMVPPPQPWQFPLPEPPSHLVDFEMVKRDLKENMRKNVASVWQYPRLAWRCSATYRATDYQGGCNGARIRLSPQKDWTVNRNLDITLNLLQPIKIKYGSGLSWADLIVLAGNTALERTGGVRIPFCGGRTDAEEDNGASDFLEPILTGQFYDFLDVKEFARKMGLTHREFAVLNAAGYAIGDCGCQGIFCRRDLDCKRTRKVQLDNKFFTRLLDESWVEYIIPATGRKLYKAVGKEHFMFATDLWYRVDGELRAVAEDYYGDNAKFLQDFMAAWNKLSIADRFNGPTGNLCKP